MSSTPIASAAPPAARPPVGRSAWVALGVLWFIYMLAVVGAATKLLHDLKAPVWAVFGAGAILQMASVHTGSYLVDQFCA